MSLADIDADAARRRLQEIAEESKAAFTAQSQRSAELNADASAAAAKEAADLKAVEQRLAEVEAARESAAAPEEEAKPRPKPATLSLGGEEFSQAREARQAAVEEPKPAPPVPPVPPMTPELVASEPPAPNRTLRLGAPEDRVVDEPSAENDKPVRKRPPRPAGDDDMSGRTWLR
jgi:hypothetical protein